MLDQEKLKSILTYNPQNGDFFWLKSAGSVRKGAKAGCISLKGKTKKAYMDIAIGGKKYRAHRLAWLYMTGEWPKGEVDHINSDGCDNSWSNLRDVTHSKNCMNKSPRRDSSTGFIGIGIYRGKYRVRVWRDGKRITVGEYSDLAEAVVKRDLAYEQAGYEVAS